MTKVSSDMWRSIGGESGLNNTTRGCGKWRREHLDCRGGKGLLRDDDDDRSKRFRDTTRGRTGYCRSCMIPRRSGRLCRVVVLVHAVWHSSDEQSRIILLKHIAQILNGSRPNQRERLFFVSTPDATNW